MRLLLATYHSLCSTRYFPHNPYTVSEVTFDNLPFTVQHQVLPTQFLPKETDGFPTGDRYFKYVLLLTYLICLLPKALYVKNRLS